MKNIYDVLRDKQQQAEQLQQEIDALRLAVKLLEEAGDDLLSRAAAGSGNGPVAVPTKQFP